MAKKKSSYICSDCGHSEARWMGRCTGCGAWNTLEERVSSTAGGGKSRAKMSTTSVAKISEISAEKTERVGTGIGELDRALGGGIVPGGVTLVGGDPGVGKSTLLMQTLASLCHRKMRTLYVSGEESAGQVAMRARRLGVPGVEDVHLLASTELGEVEDAITSLRPHVVVIDSIQTVRAGELTSALGSVSQLREVTARLVELAKRDAISLFLIGHVTKEGAIAGPKVLEHLVDTVLSFEGDRDYLFRMLRATKNRFGPANEVGVFEMVESGLQEVPEPSAHFLAERPEASSGSVVVPVAEGSRPVLLEIQALVAPATYGSARRVVSGLDTNRLAILLAVLERRCDVPVLDQDVFASVAGGMRVLERAADLALALAVVSSFRGIPLDPHTVALGEVGLTGELRAVPKFEQRLKEAAKLGFKKAICPAALLKRGIDSGIAIDCIAVTSLEDAVDELLRSS